MGQVYTQDEWDKLNKTNTAKKHEEAKTKASEERKKQVEKDTAKPGYMKPSGNVPKA